MRPGGHPETKAPGIRVLVVDDERNIRSTLRVCLEQIGCSVKEAPTPEVALSLAAQEPFDLAFVDLRLGSNDGLDLLPKLLSENRNLDVVLITAYASFDSAVEGIRRGARDYLPKPFTPAQIRHVVERVQSQREAIQKLGNLQERLNEAAPQAIFETTSPAMRTALAILERVAPSEASVLFSGESGTGKGVLARLLHEKSLRHAGTFVTVNCPSLSEHLLTSQLFGHVKGAFTGAIKDQPGRVEQAEGGTLFLDEISELGTGLQSQLLRFLQDKTYERLGEPKTRRADVRLIAASNKDLESEVKAGRFREDLLYRLNVVEVKLPPLRDRLDDILPLARSFVAFFTTSAKRHPAQFSPATEQMLRAYGWPGNIRELRNAIERAVILWPADVIEPQAFPERISGVTQAKLSIGGRHRIEDIEREHILKVMASTRTIEEAADVLGVDASTLWRKRRKYEEG